MEQDVQKLITDLHEEVENIIIRIEEISAENPTADLNLILEYAQQLFEELDSNLPE